MFSAPLPSCPEALEYLVSSLTANISPPSARSKNLIGERKKKKEQKQEERGDYIKKFGGHDSPKS